MILVDGRVKNDCVRIDTPQEIIYSLLRFFELVRRIVIRQELVLFQFPAQVVENYALKIRRHTPAEGVEKVFIKLH